MLVVVPVGLLAGAPEGPFAGRFNAPSAKATNEVARFLSGFDISDDGIVDITTPKSAVVGACCQTRQNIVTQTNHKWGYVMRHSQ